MKRRKIQKCRVCGNRELEPSIDIGEQYLSSIFPENLNYRKSLEKYPLEIVLCKKSGTHECGSLQLAYDLDLSAMYDNYPYTSGSNSSMQKILESVANSGKKFKNLIQDDVVLDIGCNDGTLLRFFEKEDVNLVGIDPAQNVETIVNSKNFTRVKSYFNEKSYKSVTSKKAKLVFSVAMFYHLGDPVQFCRDIASVLHPEGVAIIQMAYLPEMIKTNMYDNIVHEHVGYYGTQHMKWIFEKAGLEIFDVEINDVYGGSFRVFAKLKGSIQAPTPQLQSVLKAELDWDIFSTNTYAQFMNRIEKTKRDLLLLVEKIKAENKSIWIYGASTKGNTILQYCEIGSNVVVAAADSNPFKFGKFLVGSDIPIFDESRLRKEKPDYLLALPYSFVNSFREREKELVARGTKFIVPLPEVRVI